MNPFDLNLVFHNVIDNLSGNSAIYVGDGAHHPFWAPSHMVGRALLILWVSPSGGCLESSGNEVTTSCLDNGIMGFKKKLNT